MRTQAASSDTAADALFGHARRAILALLFGHGRREFYLRQIARLSDLAVGSVQRELANLVAADLVTRRVDGSQVYFRANERSPVYAELAGLMTKTSGVAGVLKAALADLANEQAILVAFVYGSVAAGTQTASSDVDLMVIGRARLRELVPALRPAQEQLGREINPTTYEPAQFRQRLAAGEHFLTRVMQAPRILLIGSDDELAGLAR
jgi:predicted nucleotidyltransferase